MILMFTWKDKEVRIAKKVLKRQRELDLPDITTSYSATVAKIV